MNRGPNLWEILGMMGAAGVIAFVTMYIGKGEPPTIKIGDVICVAGRC